MNRTHLGLTPHGLVIVIVVTLGARAATVDGVDFVHREIEPGGRIDAMAYLGEGIVVAGTRHPHPGNVHRSEDYGLTWTRIGNVTGSDAIKCLASDGKSGTGYLLTSKAHVWKSEDSGRKWRDLGAIASGSPTATGNPYGLVVTTGGTLLVADTAPGGGHIHRSTDEGLTWQDLGRISTRSLYRLQEVGDGILVNGWEGRVWKSMDDGLTWVDKGKLDDSPLYAIEYLGDGRVLMGSEKGLVFRSEDNGKTWTSVGKIGAAADDFAYFGHDRVLYSTYTGDRAIHLSCDGGRTWKSLGGVGTGKSGDWFDHVIGIHDEGKSWAIGGTNKGFVLFAEFQEEQAIRP